MSIKKKEAPRVLRWIITFFFIGMIAFKINDILQIRARTSFDEKIILLILAVTHIIFIIWYFWVTRKFPREDEFFKLVKYKAGYLTFFISIFFWGILVYISEYFPSKFILASTAFIAPIYIFLILKFLMIKGIWDVE